MQLGHCSCARLFSDVVGFQKMKTGDLQFDAAQTSPLYRNAIEKTTKLLFKSFIRDAFSLAGDTPFLKNGRRMLSGRVHHGQCDGMTCCSFHRTVRVERK